MKKDFNYYNDIYIIRKDLTDEDNKMHDSLDQFDEIMERLQKEIEKKEQQEVATITSGKTNESAEEKDKEQKIISALVTRKKHFFK